MCLSVSFLRFTFCSSRMSHGNDGAFTVFLESQVEDAKKKCIIKWKAAADMNEEECETFMKDLRGLRKHTPMFLHCGCNACHNSCNFSKPFHTKGGKLISTPKNEIIETFKSIVPLNDMSKAPTQQKYPEVLTPLICPPGSCKHFHIAIKHLLAYIQLYGGCHFRQDITHKAIHHASFAKAKQILLLFGKDVYFWIQWVRTLTKSFCTSCGSTKTMMDAIKEFFSKDMSARAHILLINAESEVNNDSDDNTIASVVVTSTNDPHDEKMDNMSKLERLMEEQSEHKYVEKMENIVSHLERLMEEQPELRKCVEEMVLKNITARLEVGSKRSRVTSL